jgi:glucose/arabinose dehydrogenase
MSTAVAAQPAGYRIETLAQGLEHPWSVAFLPDGMMLVTERAGRLRVVDATGLRAEPVGGLPAIFVSGQGGLFEVLLAEDFADSGILYLSFAHGDKDANHTRVIRARFDGQNLHGVTPVFTAQPAKSGDVHFGGRMTWLPDGTLVLGLGDGFYFREDAQRLTTHLGKIIRIHADGSVPADNPLLGNAQARPEIYSYGHRHVQGVVLDHDSGTLYGIEHGPRGGDEVNVIQPGANYGWPIITYGRDYVRSMISPFTERPGMEQPRTYWVPSIAPGGMTLYNGDAFPEWRGNLFVAALAEESVRRIPMLDMARTESQEVLFEEVGQRMRDVKTGPDGALYLLTDDPEGQLLRVVPATAPIAAPVETQ